MNKNAIPIKAPRWADLLRQEQKVGNTPKQKEYCAVGAKLGGGHACAQCIAPTAQNRIINDFSTKI